MLDLRRHFMTQHIEIQNNGFDFDNQYDKPHYIIWLMAITSINNTHNYVMLSDAFFVKLSVIMLSINKWIVVGPSDTYLTLNFL